MNTGIPGTGMATLFYITSSLLMPIFESARALRHGSSRTRWLAILRHWLLSSAMVLAVWGTFKTIWIVVSLNAHDVIDTGGPLSSLAITITILALWVLAPWINRPLARGRRHAAVGFEKR